MKILKPDPSLLKMEEKIIKEEQQKQEAQETFKKQWKESSFYSYVMEILDKEIAKSDSISGIFGELELSKFPAEKVGEIFMVSQQVTQHLKKLKQRLS